VGGGAVTGTLLDHLEYPYGIAVHDGYVYMTETRGRNTTFQGGAIRLIRYDPRTGERVTIADHPTPSRSRATDRSSSADMRRGFPATRGR
jgi:hypothetical protein